MSSSGSESLATDADRERSLRAALLVPIILTPVVLFPIYSYSVEPILLTLVVFPGFALGLGLGAFLDHYRSRLQRWDDGVVIAVAVVATFLVLVGTDRLVADRVVGVQAVALAALLWGATVQSIVSE